MQLSGDILLLLFVVALAAGVIDGIAGGGGLIVLPVLMMVGLSPAQAIATNKIQALSSVASSAHRFIRAGFVAGPQIKAKIVAALAGAATGAAAIQLVDPAILSRIAPVILICVALFFLIGPYVSRADRPQRMGDGTFILCAVLPISFYDGFFGPGTGSLYAAAFVAFLSRDLRQATAETKVLNTAGSLIAAMIFIPGGAIVWPAALATAAGGIIGAQIGAHFALRIGPPLIRTCLVIVSTLLAIRLLL